MKKFNILYLNPTAKMSGAEFSLLSLLKNLDQDKFKPFLLLPEEGPFAEEASRWRIKTFLIPEMIRFGESYRLTKLPRILKTLAKVRTIIKNHEIQLVHSNSPRVAVIGGMAARLSRIPSVSHVRDIHLSPFRHYSKATVLDYLSDAIIAVSQATCESIITRRKQLSRKTAVIYNGIDGEELDKIKPANVKGEFRLKDEEPLLVAVGLLHPAKGFHTLIRACGRIKDNFPCFKLLVVGTYLREEESKYQKELEALVKELGLRENVIFTGFRSDALALMKAADLVVHPAEYPEPLPRVLLEACGLGQPVVATRVGGIPEILIDGETGLLVPPAVSQMLGEAMLDLLKNKKKAQRLGLNARKKVRDKFSLKLHTERISEIYIKLLKKD